MDKPMLPNNQFVKNIEVDWDNLEASLSGLNEQQLVQIYDEHGWSIKDHLAHIAHWEEVLLMMFLAIPFEETMRIPYGRYPEMDDVNEAMRRQWSDFSANAILARLRRVHQQLMEKLSPLSEEDMQTPVKIFFSNLWIPEEDQSKLAEFIPAYTFSHYRDHAAWICRIKAANG